MVACVVAVFLLGCAATGWAAAAARDLPTVEAAAAWAEAALAKAAAAVAGVPREASRRLSAAANRLGGSRGTSLASSSPPPSLLGSRQSSSASVSPPMSQRLPGGSHFLHLSASTPTSSSPYDASPAGGALELRGLAAHLRYALAMSSSPAGLALNCRSTRDVECADDEGGPVALSPASPPPPRLLPPPPPPPPQPLFPASSAAAAYLCNSMQASAPPLAHTPATPTQLPQQPAAHGHGHGAAAPRPPRHAHTEEDDAFPFVEDVEAVLTSPVRASPVRARSQAIRAVAAAAAASGPPPPPPPAVAHAHD